MKLHFQEPDWKSREQVTDLLRSFTTKLIPGTWDQFSGATTPALEQTTIDLATDAMSDTIGGKNLTQWFEKLAMVFLLNQQENEAKTND
uniref:Uncharacterized protein n=1 Tax=Knipowitschia caucasica TaxID=637954 RepID=A0AAV2LSP2_KNICA